MRYATHTRPKAHQSNNEPASVARDRITYNAAASGSASLRRAVENVIAGQARCWGIRVDQTRALLLDHRVVA